MSPLLLDRNVPASSRGQRHAGAAVRGRATPSHASLPPGATRGLLPLLAAAFGVGALRAGFGIHSARKRGDRQRASIYEAYGRGKERLDLTQGDQRQSTAEGLVARGLAQGGDVNNGTAATPGGARDTSARTLAGQTIADLGHEQILEQNDMLAKRNNAIDEVTDAQRQSTIDAIGSGISTGMSVYGMGKEIGAMRGSGAAGAATPAGAGTIRGAYGIDPLNPVMPTPGPAFHPALNTTIGDGQANYNFRRGT